MKGSQIQLFCILAVTSCELTITSSDGARSTEQILGAWKWVDGATAKPKAEIVFRENGTYHKRVFPRPSARA